jgi:uracil-DNA glycosylase
MRVAPFRVARVMSTTIPPLKKARTLSPSPSSSPPLQTPQGRDEFDEFDEFDIADDDLIKAVQHSENADTKQESKPVSKPSPKPDSKPAAKLTSQKTPQKTPKVPPMTIPTLPSGVSYGGLRDDRLALERASMDPEWFSRLASAMRSDTFTRLKEFLEREEQAGKVIYPPAPLIHSWSRLTPLSKIKVVIVGQDPYHQPGQACGLSFSVPPGKAVPASLQNIYKELSDEFPGFVPPRHGCLEGWARQGVLMLNACLVRFCADRRLVQARLGLTMEKAGSRLRVKS